MFIFLLQTIWLYISELAGKDLDFATIIKFLTYFTPKLIPLVLPLSILVASLMVFGNFSENYEFAAMKSNGISLQRAMRSLTFFILILSATAFLFANTVIPNAEYKILNLRRNIAKLKPAMIISEGQFSQIGDNFNIKVDKKSGDRGQFLESIVIHQKKGKTSGNFTVIIATEGELVSAENSNTLSLVLRDGNYYDDILPKDIKKKKRMPFAKSYFEEYTINIDLTEINNIDLDEQKDISNHNMYSIQELIPAIDTLSQNFTKDISVFGETMLFRSGIKNLDKNYTPEKIEDTTKYILDAYHPKDQKKVLEIALGNSKGTIQTVVAKKNEFFIKAKNINKHEIALHEKYVLAIACIILFFVGAPLGAIIKKGGLGLPMVIAILLFLTYHFIGIFAKNSAEDGSMHPFLASWLSTLIMLPLGIWLTMRATTDQGIFDFDAFFQRFKSKDPVVEIALNEMEFSISLEEKETLTSLKDNQLIDIVQNYLKYNYSHNYRLGALSILEERGVSEMQLKVQGKLENIKYKSSASEYKKYLQNSKKAFTYYLISLALQVCAILLKIFKIELPAFLILITDILSALIYVVFIVYLIRSFINYNSIYKHLGKKNGAEGGIVYYLMGIPLYFIAYFYFKKKVKEDLQVLT